MIWDPRESYSKAQRFCRFLVTSVQPPHDTDEEGEDRLDAWSSKDLSLLRSESEKGLLWPQCKFMNDPTAITPSGHRCRFFQLVSTMGRDDKRADMYSNVPMTNPNSWLTGDGQVTKTTVSQRVGTVARWNPEIRQVSRCVLTRVHNRVVGILRFHFPQRIKYLWDWLRMYDSLGLLLLVPGWSAIKVCRIDWT